MKQPLIFPTEGPRSYRILRLLLSRTVNQLEQSSNEPQTAQLRVLTGIRRNLVGTALESHFKLKGIRTLQDFRTAIPIQTYTDVEPFISRVVSGEHKVMSREKISGFVETSGTQSTPKLIPITKSWSSHIRTAQLLWVLGLLRDYPAIAQGDIAHIVSSATERYTTGGLPIGANTGRMTNALPKGVRNRFILSGLPEITDPDLRHYVHLRLMLQKSIRMFVTANPSTVALYARKLNEYQEYLSQDLWAGTICQGPASQLSTEVRDILQSRISKAAIPREWTLGQSLPLSVIGCWTGGPAGWFVRQFPELLGADIPVRDVGITASEGYFAIPLSSEWDGGVLWNQGEILEFQDDVGNVHWGWELQQDKEYSLIISSRNGLLRYAMRDRIRVTGFYRNTPIIAFVGKEGRFINAVGEKVTEEQIVLAMTQWNSFVIGFTATVDWSEVPCIHLGVEWASPNQPSQTELAQKFDAALQTVSVEYASKRQSQRLGLPIVSFFKPTVYRAFRNWRVSNGASSAQVKDCIVASPEEWRFLSEFG